MTRIVDLIAIWIRRFGCDEDDWDPYWDTDDWRWKVAKWAGKTPEEDE